jgi:hypothetical protein
MPSRAPRLHQKGATRVSRSDQLAPVGWVQKIVRAEMTLEEDG